MWVIVQYDNSEQKSSEEHVLTNYDMQVYILDTAKDSILKISTHLIEHYNKWVYIT